MLIGMALLQFNLETKLEGDLLLGAFCGFIGAIVMTIIIYLARTFGHQKLNFPFLLGTFWVDIEQKTKAYLVGNILHLIIGACWGMLYIFTLSAMGVRPN